MPLAFLRLLSAAAQRLCTPQHNTYVKSGAYRAAFPICHEGSKFDRSGRFRTSGQGSGGALRNAIHIDGRIHYYIKYSHLWHCFSVRKIFWVRFEFSSGRVA
eukprot:1345347-Pyramimonas_sp.AAC.1